MSGARPLVLVQLEAADGGPQPRLLLESKVADLEFSFAPIGADEHLVAGEVLIETPRREVLVRASQDLDVGREYRFLLRRRAKSRGAWRVLEPAEERAMEDDLYALRPREREDVRYMIWTPPERFRLNPVAQYQERLGLLTPSKAPPQPQRWAVPETVPLVGSFRSDDNGGSLPPAFLGKVDVGAAKGGLLAVLSSGPNGAQEQVVRLATLSFTGDRIWFAVDRLTCGDREILASEGIPKDPGTCRGPRVALVQPDGTLAEHRTVHLTLEPNPPKPRRPKPKRR